MKDPDLDPYKLLRYRYGSEYGGQIITVPVRIWIRGAQKLSDPTYPDPEHCF